MSTTFLSEEMTRYYEDQWIEKQLKELSNGRYRFMNESQYGKPKKEFWSIISNDEWKKCNYHFELRWKQGIPITEVEQLNLRVHLESQHIDKEIDSAVRAFFIKHGAVFSDNPDRQNTIKEICGMKLDLSVTPDFSSEETAIKTIREIIRILDSPAYQKCADIANAFIRELPNGNE